MSLVRLWSVSHLEGRDSSQDMGSRAKQPLHQPTGIAIYLTHHPGPGPRLLRGILPTLGSVDAQWTGLARSLPYKSRQQRCLIPFYRLTRQRNEPVSRHWVDRGNLSEFRITIRSWKSGREYWREHLPPTSRKVILFAGRRASRETPSSSTHLFSFYFWTLHHALTYRVR